RERDEAGLDPVLGEHAKSVPHHGGARNLPERADMGKPRRPVAGLENHFILGPRLEPRENLARLLERPGVRLLRELAQFRSSIFDHVGHSALSARAYNSRMRGSRLIYQSKLADREVAQPQVRKAALL